MPEPKDTEPKDANPKAELLVDAQSGAEAFAATEGHESHQALVGVEKEAVNVGMVLGVVFGTVIIVSSLVTFAFTMAEVTSRETLARINAQADYPELREVRADASTRLAQYNIVNAQEETYQIPIDQAINLIVNEQYQNQDVADYSSELVLLPSR